MNNKKLGGLYGALLGDACGCPYEFKRPASIPPFDQIEMIPPKDFNRTWKDIPVGTYTDDGAQALCLLKVLVDRVPHAVHMMLRPEDAKKVALKKDDDDLVVNLRAKLLAWLGGGYMSVDNKTFDSGAQTKRALLFCDSTEEVIKELSRPMDSGNGSLMRSIPVALIATSLHEAMRLGALQSLPTHPNARCQLTCALYCGIAYKMLEGFEADDVITGIIAEAHKMFPNDQDELNLITQAENIEPTGTGYVVDAFWSALWALRTGKTFKEVIKYSISLGMDTDTTACIAGGLAGIKYGYDNLPQDWLDLLRGKYLIEPLAEQIT
jgi:ADP-ribosyl-[dinitrogen reductase] hydrolase